TAMEVATMLLIRWNGSKWAGEAPDPLETLLQRMKEHAIEPFWLAGDMCEDAAIDSETGLASPTVRHFGGNFVTYSHAFGIETDEPETIAKLRAAIADNMRTFYGNAAGVQRELAERELAREARQALARRRY